LRPEPGFSGQNTSWTWLLRATIRPFQKIFLQNLVTKFQGNVIQDGRHPKKTPSFFGVFKILPTPQKKIIHLQNNYILWNMLFSHEKKQFGTL
jgi:hypothetical protein